MVYNKLVRDRIPERIQSKGELVKFHIAGEEEYLTKLAEKLSEEVQEYLKDPSAEELADILEVLYALAAVQGVSREALENIRARKEEERGAFTQKIILEEA